MYKKITVLACMGLAGLAQAFTPQSGTWVVTSELNGAPGRGMAIDVQGNTLVMQMYAYEGSGHPTFYMTSGTLENNQLIAKLGRYSGGRHLGSGPLIGQEDGSPGQVSLRFTSGLTGVMTLPGEGEVQISRYDFGTARSPEALAGAWLYAVAASTEEEADLIKLHQVMPSVVGGGGLVVDPAKGIGCEFLPADEGPYNLLCGQVAGSNVNWSAKIKVVGNEGEGIALDPRTGEPNGVVYVRKLVSSQGQQLGFFAPEPPQTTGLPTPQPAPPTPATPTLSYAGVYNISGGGLSATFTVDSSGTIARCTAGALVICSGQVTNVGGFSLRGDDGDGTVVTLSGSIDNSGRVTGTYVGTSDGVAISGGFSGTGPSPTSSGGGTSTGTGQKALAFCWMNKSQTLWFCDGPTQVLLTSWKKEEAMRMVGCSNGQQISIGHITLKRNTDGNSYVGPVYVCKDKLESWDRDIRKYWTGLASGW